MVADALDGAFLGEVLDETAGNGTVDLELLHKRGAGDAEDLGDLLADLGKALLVKEDLVVELVLDLDLGPGLLLGLSTLGSLANGGFLRSLGGSRGRLALIFTTQLLCLGLKKSQM